MRISIFYKKSLEHKNALEFRTEILWKGVQPEPMEPRAACGVLLISLGCFAMQTSIKGVQLDGYEGAVVVDTGSRSIYTTSPEPAMAREIVRATVKIFAQGAGISGDLTESVTASLIGEAVQLLNADPLKFNSPGGAA